MVICNPRNLFYYKGCSITCVNYHKEITEMASVILCFRKFI